MDRELEKRLLKLEEFMERQERIETARKYTLILKVMSEISALTRKEGDREQHIQNLIEYADQAVGLLNDGLVEDIRGIGDIPLELRKIEGKNKKQIESAINKNANNCSKQLYHLHEQIIEEYGKNKEGT